MRAPAVFAVAAGLILVAGGYLYWKHSLATQIPEGLASANGRVEVTRVDIASKLAGRVAEIRVNEGDSVAKTGSM